MLLTSFLCLLKKEFISKRPSLTFGGEKNDRLEAMCWIMLMIFDPKFLIEQWNIKVVLQTIME